MKAPYETEAVAFCSAIRALANNPGALDNLESYLSHHFAGWLEHQANTPEGIAFELTSFADGDELPF